MRHLTPEKQSRSVNLIVLIVFGVAFGSVEAVVVYYLRALMHFHENYAIFHYKVYLNLGFITFVSPIQSLALNNRISDIEVTREVATIVMLARVTFVAAEDWRRCLGSFLVAFGC